MSCTMTMFIWCERQRAAASQWAQARSGEQRGRRATPARRTWPPPPAATTTMHRRRAGTVRMHDRVINIDVTVETYWCDEKQCDAQCEEGGHTRVGAFAHGKGRRRSSHRSTVLLLLRLMFVVKPNQYSYLCTPSNTSYASWRRPSRKLFK